MFKEQMNKFKSLILKKTEGNDDEKKSNKRKIENLVVFLVILIITLIVINTILNNNEVDVKKDDESGYKVLANLGTTDEEDYDDELEKRLENILATMVGVRKC